MTKLDGYEQDLDGLLALAIAQPPLDSGPLQARVLADAMQHLPQPPGLSRQRVPSAATGFWATLANALGGKSVLAGLGTAAVAGVMLGFVQPASFTALTDTIFAESPLDGVDLLPGIDAILTEG